MHSERWAGQFHIFFPALQRETWGGGGEGREERGGGGGEIEIEIQVSG